MRLDSRHIVSATHRSGSVRHRPGRQRTRRGLTLDAAPCVPVWQERYRDRHAVVRSVWVRRGSQGGNQTNRAGSCHRTRINLKARRKRRRQAT